MKPNLNVPIILNAIDLAGKAPSEIQLLPLGRWEGYRNPVTQQLVPFEITRADVKAAVDHNAERKTRGPQRDLVVDYEHQTLSGGVAPAAGWMGDLADKGGEGLWATNVRWTPKAKGHIETGEYRYISPVFAKGVTDKRTGATVPMVVFHAALTNEPFLDELPPLISKDTQHHLYIFNSQTFQQEDSMDPQLLALLTVFFSLAATAKPDEFVTKVNWLTEQLKAAGIVAKEGTALTAQMVIDQIKTAFAEAKTFKANYAAVATALGAVGTDPVEKLTALVATAKDRTGVVSKADFDSLQLKFSEREVDELIASAMQKGKISPATRDTYRALALKDRQAFVDLMAKTADFSIVPLQQIEPATALPARTDSPTVDVIAAHAEKNKMSFKDAAIALTTRKN